MGNLITYLRENGDVSFLDRGFGAVDALLLAQFAYFNFDGLVPAAGQDEVAVSLASIRQNVDYGKLFSVNWYKEELRILFELLVASRRFQNMKINYFQNVIDEEKQSQFSAVTFFLGDGNIVISFRGTDEALSGWKEDLNMAYLTPVPSQEMACKYMKMIEKQLMIRKKVRLFLTGHSKGGNLAVYVAMYCGKRLQNKIDTVYNFDGPGFRPEFWKQKVYEEMKGKIRKLVPQSSFVGMIMEQGNDYEIIASNVSGMLQHLPLAWRVRNAEFVYCEKMDDDRIILNAEINRWILSLDREELRQFLDEVYEILDSTKALSLKELGDHWLENLVAAGTYYRRNRLNPKNREIFWESANLFLKLLVEDGTEKIRRNGLLQSIRERIEKIEEI